MTALVLLACAAGAPPAAPSVVKAEPDAALTAKFRQTERWIGADGAFSVPLSDTRTIWLFSDTWVGRIQDGKRKPTAMVNNSVGVQEGNGPDATVRFHIKKNGNGKSLALFAPADGEGWFWLFAGHHAGGKLHVFLPRMEKAGAGAFGFKNVDLWLGTVTNPNELLADWKIDYAKVPFASFEAGRKRSFGSAVLTVGDHAYVYGYEETPGKPFPARELLVARVPTDALADFTRWRFLANGAWKPDAKDATGAAGGLASEFSVSYLPGLKRYALVYTQGGLSDRVVGRFAPAPEGPWSEPVLLYTCPEMKKDKKVFTYAAKAHPHLATGNELVISYATNSYELGPVMNNADLYWPTFVRVKLK